ncbi:MAG TPA: ribonuclease III [Firmicutes bacterium]|nr:ribonuclease III [Bacillota bacterium]
MTYLKELSTFLSNKGINYRKIDVYAQAFTHSSYVNEHRHLKIEDNERLEYLGDAVLELTVSNYLYSLKPILSEGEMTKIRAQLVCEPSLETYARNLNLGKLLLLGRGEENSGGRERPTVLADAFEAFIGAMYLDLGLDTVYTFVHAIIHKAYQEGEVTQVFDYKSTLQELVQADSKKAIEYRIVSETGPAHNRSFEANVMLDGIVLGRGMGKTKKEAEQQAAKGAIEILAKHSDK